MIPGLLDSQIKGMNGREIARYIGASIQKLDNLKSRLMAIADAIDRVRSAVDELDDIDVDGVMDELKVSDDLASIIDSVREADRS